MPINKDFIEDDTTQATTQATTQTTTQTKQERIIKIIRANPNITLEEIGKQIGLKRDGVKYHITKLQKLGKVKHEGKDNNGYWKIIED